MSHRYRTARAAVTLIGATALVAGPIATSQAAVTEAPPSGATVAAAAKLDRTSKVEARRVDSVAKPRLSWFSCNQLGGQCATVKLPLDYDNPRGAKVEVAVVRIKATNQKARIGTLFLNPGGPGGSGVQSAAGIAGALSPEVRARFDIVGFDPRGTNYSDNVKCFRSVAAQTKALRGMEIAFPYTAAETKAFTASATALAKGCSTTGKPLSASMSTAQVARDMDVLRRAVGDKKLTYLGFSYGTELGNTYANMFPDRVRAITLDGNLDPRNWAGSKASSNTPVTVRVGSGVATARAMAESLRLCKAAGGSRCGLANQGDPATIYNKVMAGLRKAPLTTESPEGPLTLKYQDVVTVLTGSLTGPFGPEMVTSLISDLYTLQSVDATRAARTTANTSLKTQFNRFRVEVARTKSQQAKAAKAFGYGFPYDNGVEAFTTVLCTDSRNPRTVGAWTKAAAATDRTAPHFGRFWAWSSAPCATNVWRATDEDRYTGPFNKHTGPVLVVGNYWDPSTPYSNAVAVSKTLPNSRLISSDNFGHTALGTSTCVDQSVATFLLSGKLPASRRCSTDIKPFTTEIPPGEGLGEVGLSVTMRALSQVSFLNN